MAALLVESMLDTSTPFRFRLSASVIAWDTALLKLAVTNPTPMAKPRAMAITAVRLGSRRRFVHGQPGGAPSEREALVQGLEDHGRERRPRS